MFEFLCLLESCMSRYSIEVELPDIPEQEIVELYYCLDESTAFNTVEENELYDDIWLVRHNLSSGSVIKLSLHSTRLKGEVSFVRCIK